MLIERKLTFINLFVKTILRCVELFLQIKYCISNYIDEMEQNYKI